MEYWGSRLSAGGLEAYKNSLGPVENRHPQGQGFSNNN